MNGRYAILLTLLLLMVPATMAVWDPKPVKFSEGFSESLGPFLVRLDEIDPSTKTAMVTVSQKGSVIDVGPVSTKSPYVLPGKLMIAINGFAKAYSYGSVVNANASLWVDAKIVSWRFPKTMSGHNNVHYDAFIVAENTGASSAYFKTEIVQEGLYDASRGMYETETGYSPKVLDINLPYRTIYAIPGDVGRADYKEMNALSRVSSGTGGQTDAVGVMLNLYYKESLLDSVYIPDFHVTSGKTAGILDMMIPDTMRQDTSYEAVAVLQNDGLDDTGSQRNKFNLELKTKGFTLSDSNMERKSASDAVPPSLLRGELTYAEPESWRFQITPHVQPGKYTLRFTLSGRIDGSGSNTELDAVDVPITVTKGYTTRIERMELSGDSGFGKTTQLTVTINNQGAGRIVRLTLQSPVLETPIAKVIQLPGYSMTETTFEVPVIMTGKIPLEAMMYTHYSWNNKNFDPTGEDQYLIDKKSVTLGVAEPSAKPVKPVEAPAEEKIEEAPAEEETQEPVIVDETQLVPPAEEPKTTAPTTAPATAAAFDWSSLPYQQYLPWILIAIAAVLLLIGLKIIYDAYSEDTEDVEEEEYTPAPRKKGKKR